MVGMAAVRIRSATMPGGLGLALGRRLRLRHVFGGFGTVILARFMRNGASCREGADDDGRNQFLHANSPVGCVRPYVLANHMRREVNDYQWFVASEPIYPQRRSFRPMMRFKVQPDIFRDLSCKICSVAPTSLRDDEYARLFP